ncbi:unnamed protein product [Allacma fusca]|uniref:Uncharacterized protein n=1 Tax=Allacma fusca TaxID=39272 RepID=A0A8J2PIE2_9HEXA|nr:unnamed protein product [Allacma fusca]
MTLMFKTVRMKILHERTLIVCATLSVAPHSYTTKFTSDLKMKFAIPLIFATVVICYLSTASSIPDTEWRDRYSVRIVRARHPIHRPVNRFQVYNNGWRRQPQNHFQRPIRPARPAHTEDESQYAAILG